MGLNMRRLPFVMPSMDVLFASPRKTYAHYFYTFPQSIDNLAPAVDYYNRNYLNPAGEANKFLKQGGFCRARPLPVLAPNSAANWPQLNMQSEIALAIAGGITGFTFDILGLSDAILPTENLQQLMLAAAAVDKRFKIVPMLDMSSLGAAVPAGQIVALMQLLTSNATLSPVLDRAPDGRIILAAFNASIESEAWWAALIVALNAVNIDVLFVPVLLGGPGDAGTLDPITGELADWGTAIPSSATALAAAVAAAHAKGLAFMLPVLPQQFRPKDAIFWESSNSVAFVDAWLAAINGKADAVQVVTWSDFSESGQIQPYTDASLALDIGTGFYDLNAYYSTWFLTGVQPPIVRDVLYWFYRKTKSTDPHLGQVDVETVISSVEESNIECLAFLTAPGTVLINGAAMAAPSGITSLKQPTAPGNPVLALQRNGSDVFRFTAPVSIGTLANGTLDLTYWSGSGSHSN
jgi:hypothetical protein